MWRDKKPVVVSPAKLEPEMLPVVQTIEEKPMVVETTKNPTAIPGEANRTLLGRTLVIKGDISGSEDLVIAGKFEGTLNVQGQCVTVGPEGTVKADIQAARVVIHGSVHGNITVRDRVEIHKSGHVVGDMVAPGISIEDGAYFKGKIEILREGDKEATKPPVPLRVKEASSQPV